MDEGASWDREDPSVQAFADRLQNPLWVFDIEREAMAWANRAAVALWSAESLDDLRQRDFSATMTEPVRQRLGSYLRAFRAGETVTDSWTFFPGGQPTTVHCVCQGHRLADGRVAMLVEGTRLEALDSPTQRALETLRHSAMAVSVYDRSLDVISRNPAAEELLGAHADLASEFVDPAAFQQLCEQLTADGAATVEARLETGEARPWFRLEVRCMPDPETGEWLTVVGAADISDRKAFEDELQTERKRLQTLVANLRGAVLVEDEYRRVVLANQAFCDSFGLCARSEDLVETDARALAEPFATLVADPPAFRERSAAILRNRRPVRSEEFTLADGRTFECDYMPIFLEGAYRGHLWQYWDVTHRKSHEQSLQELANTDPVTGLPNRRHAMERLEEEVARVARSGIPATTMLVDLDYFKAINDRHGHAAGDEALIHFSEVLRRELRTTDVAGRIGGDEFLLLLPVTGTDGAREIADRLHAGAARLPVPSSGEGNGLSLSIGMATLDGGDGDSRRVLMRADAALYEAKSCGRGTTVRFLDDSCETR